MRDDVTLPPAPQQRATKTILIVEDDTDLAWTLTQFFREETSYVTMWTHKGSEALQVMKGTRPDLLLLDYRLPDMNGLELYDQLSAGNVQAAIPAILVTANLGRLQREVGKRTMLGIDKPFDLDILREAIDKLLA
jgi:DNA-binding response OmpR family regulator